MKQVMQCAALFCLALQPLLATDGKYRADANATLQELQQGNARFAAGKSEPSNQDKTWHKKKDSDQSPPLAAVLTCSDAGMAPEIILNTGPGDLIVIRTPAALANAGEAAAMEHAVVSHNLPVLLIIGHPDCRLIADLIEHTTFFGHMKALVEPVLISVEHTRDERLGMPTNLFIAEAARANVWQSIEQLFKFSPEIRKRSLKGRLWVIGAFYVPDSRTIEWLGRHPEERTIIKLYDTPAYAE